MKLSIRIATVLTVFGLMTLGSMETALADDGISVDGSIYYHFQHGSFETALADDGISVDGAQILPDVGPQVEGLTPGADGYKVFGPDAIESQTVQPEKRYAAPNTAMRYAITDIWKTSSGYIHGSHTSESDLVEDQIWVDGAIRRISQGWRNSCSMHNAGMIATCHTEMPDGNGSQTYEAKSWHHFHKTGYIDWDPITNDIMTG